MPRFDAQNLAIAVVIFTFGGVAWVCGTAGQNAGRIVLPDTENAANSRGKRIVEPVVVESQEFSSVVEADSENVRKVVAVRAAKEPVGKPSPVQRSSTRIRTGTIRGRIVFAGTPPEHELMFEGLPKVDSAVCGQIEHYHESILVNPLNNGIKNVFVYLARRPEPVPESDAPLTAARMTFRGCRLEPRCVVVQTSQEFQFHHDDPLLHNVDMKPARNMVGSYSPAWQGQVTAFNFKHSEALPFQMTCAIHPWIRAWLLVTDHPFAVVTNSDGEFVIPDLPHGNHRLRIFHERARFLDLGFKITVDAADVELPELSFDASEFGY